MKKNFSRYFSSNRWTRLPLHKMIAAFSCAGLLAVSVGTGVVAAALQAWPEGEALSADAGAPSSAVAEPTATPEPTVTPEPSATPQPDIVVRMELSVVQQDLGIEVLRDIQPEPTPTPEPTATPEPTPSATPRRSFSGASSTGPSPRATPSPTPSPSPSPSPSPTPSPTAAADEVTQEPVLGVAFKITLTDSNKKETEYEIDPKTGVALIEDLEPGDYTVALQPQEGYIVPDPEKVTIKKKVVYEPDEEAIKEQIKSDSEASAEDTKPETGSAPALENTVTYAESKTETKELGMVYFASDNLSGGYLRYADGTVSPYKGVLDETGTYIVKAELDPSKVTAAASLAARGQAGIHLLGGRGWLAADDTEGTPDPVPTETPAPDPTETPTPDPTETPTPDPTETPTPDPTETPTPEATETPTPAPTETPSPTASPTPVPTPNLPQTIILYENGQVVGNSLFKLEAKTLTEPVYTGWQTIGGQQYYYSPETHKPVTGPQVIDGQLYNFGADGVRKSELQGIDVSKYQPNIDWAQVRASGIDFVIIRAGYRGWGTGALVEDPLLASHVQGARAAGIKIGLYFFTQAVNEQEAADEAGFVLSLIRKYGIPMSYPVYYDTENSDGGGAGRADHLSRSQRTANAVTFCQTIQSGGYTPGVYSYRSWLTGNLNFSSISRYKIWVAHFASKLDFNYKYDMWQYTSSGSVPGIPGRVDRNVI